MSYLFYPIIGQWQLKNFLHLATKRFVFLHHGDYRKDTATATFLLVAWLGLGKGIWSTLKLGNTNNFRKKKNSHKRPGCVSSNWLGKGTFRMTPSLGNKWQDTNYTVWSLSTTHQTQFHSIKLNALVTAKVWHSMRDNCTHDLYEIIINTHLYPQTELPN